MTLMGLLQLYNFSLNAERWKTNLFKQSAFVLHLKIAAHPDLHHLSACGTAIKACNIPAIQKYH